MPKHKTRNIYLWITWEVNTVNEMLMKSGQFISFTKEKISSKFFTKTVAWKLVPDPFVFAKNEA